MPTYLPIKRKSATLSFALFAVLIAASLFAIEIIDPAPTEIQAASIASP